MFPELFTIGNFTLRTFGVVLVISFIAAIAWASQRAPRYGLTKAQIQDSAFWLIISGVLGARITYILLHWSHYSQNTSELFSLKFEGLTSFGGLIGGFIALLILQRKQKFSLWAFLDTVCLPVLLAHAVGRLGCFFNGCCYGHAVTTSPPGVEFVGLQGLYLPAQLYDAAMVALGVFLLALFEHRFRKPGLMFGAMLGVYGISRFIYEFWRIGASSERMAGLPISFAQLTSLVMVLLGLAILVRPVAKTERPLPG